MCLCAHVCVCVCVCTRQLHELSADGELTLIFLVQYPSIVLSIRLVLFSESLYESRNFAHFCVNVRHNRDQLGALTLIKQAHQFAINQYFLELI